MFDKVSLDTKQIVLQLLDANLGATLCKPMLVHADCNMEIHQLVFELQRSRYIATLSTGRSTIHLVLMRDTTLLGSPCRCMLVNRNTRWVVSTRLSFHSSIFEKTTVLVGELVTPSDITHPTLFMVDEALVVDGTPVNMSQFSYSQRRHMLVELIMRCHVPDALFDQVKIDVKPICTLHDMSPLLRVLTESGGNAIYLTLCRLYGKGRRIYVETIGMSAHTPRSSYELRPPTKELKCPDVPTKPKVALYHIPIPRPHQTMSIRRTDLPDVYEVLEDGKWANVCLPRLDASMYMRHAFSQEESSTSLIMRCTYNEAFCKWEPSPETFSVIEGTNQPTI